jgi:hypothetical protein
MSITVRAMLKTHLVELGADGLCSTYACDESCGCGVDDLAPCECISLNDCVAAKKIGGLYFKMARSEEEA